MPVEASDIVQTVMDTGDSSYTGCEEGDTRSDDRVRKITELTSAHLLSNQIHNTEVIDQRKPWKSRSTHQLSLQRRADNSSGFSATERILLWKTRKTKSSCPFTFLMRVSIALCQTE
jgi:hypothetical protein